MAILHTSRPSNLGRVRRRWLITIGGLASVVGLYLYCNDQFLHAVVPEGGPHVAASDRAALCALLDSGREAARLQAAAKIFAVAPGTHCKVVILPGGVPCGAAPEMPAIKVRLLEGPRRGQEVWLLLYRDVRWPIHMFL